MSRARRRAGSQPVRIQALPRTTDCPPRSGWACAWSCRWFTGRGAGIGTPTLAQWSRTIEGAALAYDQRRCGSGGPRVDDACTVRYADAVTKTTTSIESELRNLRALPTPISSWHVEAGPDATEEPAVWVWVTLAHDDVDASTRARVRDLVRTSVSNMVGNEAHWVYVRFRAASESEQTS